MSIEVIPALPDAGYSLHLLTTAEDLYLESAALGNRFAYLCKADTLKDLLRSEKPVWLGTGPVTLQKLGHQRFYSLRRDGEPAATIVYDVPTQTITGILTLRGAQEDSPLRKPLLSALGHLSEVVPIERIKPVHNTIGVLLGKDGRKIQLARGPKDWPDFDTLLMGGVEVDEHLPQAFLERAAASACFSLRITSPEAWRRLPPDVRADIAYFGDTLDAPHVRTLGDLSMQPQNQKPLKIRLPALEEVGDLSANRVGVMLTPRLRRAGDITLSEIRWMEFRRLETCRTLCVRSTKKVDFPKLHRAGHIHLVDIGQVRLTALRSVGPIDLIDVKESTLAPNVKKRAQPVELPDFLMSFPPALAEKIQKKATRGKLQKLFHMTFLRYDERNPLPRAQGHSWAIDTQEKSYAQTAADLRDATPDLRAAFGHVRRLYIAASRTAKNEPEAKAFLKEMWRDVISETLGGKKLDRWLTQADDKGLVHAAQIACGKITDASGKKWGPYFSWVATVQEKLSDQTRPACDAFVGALYRMDERARKLKSLIPPPAHARFM